MRYLRLRTLRPPAPAPVPVSPAPPCGLCSSTAPLHFEQSNARWTSKRCLSVLHLRPCSAGAELSVPRVLQSTSTPPPRLQSASSSPALSCSSERARISWRRTDALFRAAPTSCAPPARPAFTPPPVSIRICVWTGMEAGRVEEWGGGEGFGAGECGVRKGRGGQGTGQLAVRAHGRECGCGRRCMRGGNEACVGRKVEMGEQDAQSATEDTGTGRGERAVCTGMDVDTSRERMGAAGYGDPGSGADSRPIPSRAPFAPPPLVRAAFMPAAPAPPPRPVPSTSGGLRVSVVSASVGDLTQGEVELERPSQ
ncbi:hypothetical protein C8R44DRAFT_331004 [Mycena epipterygia]|nr:hypothetical protein C8R44DRAFT_331004 [Mycena epipterygia]